MARCEHQNALETYTGECSPDDALALMMRDGAVGSPQRVPKNSSIEL